MSSRRRAGSHERSSMSRKNCAPVKIVARQGSRCSRRGQLPPPWRAAQSSQPSGTTWVWTSTRTLLRLHDGIEDANHRSLSGHGGGGRGTLHPRAEKHGGGTGGAPGGGGGAGREAAGGAGG